MRPGRGRKPKPVELIELHGNPGKRPIPTDIPKPEKLYDIPQPPEYMHEDAKKIWNYLALHLTRTRILSVLDVFKLEMACNTMMHYRWGVKKVAPETLVMVIKNEDGSIKAANKSPYLYVIKDAELSFNTHASDFGLSPAARRRLKESDNLPEADPLQEFINLGKAKAN